MSANVLFFDHSVTNQNNKNHIFRLFYLGKFVEQLLVFSI